MLKEIKINNYLLIENEKIEFQVGVNVLTGTTGSGKSILLDAISLIGGQRANNSLISKNSDKAKIEAVFSLDEKLKENLDLLELDSSDEDVVIYREIGRDGKNKVRINGELVNLKVLQQLMEGIIDFHSQHQTIALLDEKEYLEIIDKFLDNSAELENYQKIYLKYSEVKKEIAIAENNLENLDEKLELINFKLKELEQVKEIEELDELEQRKSELAKEISAKQKNDELTYKLDSVQKELTTLISQYADLIELKDNEVINNAIMTIENMSYNLAVSDSTTLLEKELDQITDQLSLVKRLERKYKKSIEEIILDYETLSREKIYLEDLNSSLAKSREKILEIEKELQIDADELTRQRLDVAAYLSDAINNEFKELSLEDATFKIEIEKTAYNVNGRDKVNFFIQTNKGSDYATLGKVASGGELSRFILAIKKVFSEKVKPSLLIFDEIDSGVSGVAASKMAKGMRAIAQNSQLIIISHNPQVIAAADTYFSVYKEVENEMTKTYIKQLENEEIPRQIAQIMSVEKIDDTAIEMANNLIKQIKQ